MAACTRMHVVRLLAPPLAGEDHSKDIDFSPEGIRARWAAGYADTARVLAQAPWTHPSIRSRASSCTTPPPGR